MKKHLGTIAKLLLTALLLGWIFHHHGLVNAILPRLGAMLGNWRWTGTGLVFMGLSLWFEGMRWGVLVRGLGYPVPQRAVWSIMMTAHFFNISSLGTTGGDTYRVFAMARRTGAPRVPMLATVLLDHMLGSVGIGIVFLVLHYFLREAVAGMDEEVRRIVHGFAVFMAASAGGICFSALICSRAVYGWASRRHPLLFGWKPLRLFTEACDDARRNWRASLGAVAMTMLLYLAQFMTFYCAIRAVGGDAPLLPVMGAMPMVDAAAGLPITISGLGVREKAFETLMGAYAGLPGDLAVSASLAGWLMGVVWALLGGVVFVRGGPGKDGRDLEDGKDEGS